MIAIYDNEGLANLLAGRIHEGWVIIFEHGGLKLLGDIEYTVYTPNTDKNYDFELTSCLGNYGYIAIGICKKNADLKAYFLRNAHSPLDIYQTAFIISPPADNGKTRRLEVFMYFDEDYTDIMMGLIEEISGFHHNRKQNHNQTTAEVVE